MYLCAFFEAAIFTGPPRPNRHCLYSDPSGTLYSGTKKASFLRRFIGPSLPLLLDSCCRRGTVSTNTTSRGDGDGSSEFFNRKSFVQGRKLESKRYLLVRDTLNYRQ